MLSLPIDELIDRVIRRHNSAPVNAEPGIRNRVARDIAAVTSRIYPFTQQDHGPIGELSESGITRFGNRLLSFEQAVETRSYLESLPVYNAHVTAMSDRIPRRLNQKFPRKSRGRSYPYGCYRLQDVLAAPHLLETALSEEVLDLTASYLGCTPTLYSMNAFWTFPQQLNRVTRLWHRDLDDYRFVTLFFFLTDVDDSGGQHYFVRFTHNTELMNRHLMEQGCQSDIPHFAHGRVPQSHPFYRNNTIVVSGAAGTSFLADTFGIHRANPPSRDRLLCWARFGLHAGPSYKNDQLAPVDRRVTGNRVTWNRRLKYITRLILN